LLAASRGFVWFEPELIDQQPVFKRLLNGMDAAVSLSALNGPWRSALRVNRRTEALMTLNVALVVGGVWLVISLGLGVVLGKAIAAANTVSEEPPRRAAA
jgi:hypothetical protein